MTDNESCRAQRFLMLGCPTGWHADQLRSAAQARGHQFDIVPYESLAASISTASISTALTSTANDPTTTGLGSKTAIELSGQGRLLGGYDAILTRTMPAGSLEKITFRLATLHAIADGLVDRVPIINPPRSLEWSIDKFATLARLTAAGYPTPPTCVVQSRGEAIAAFDSLGGDCIVKPIFGGEGHGVMRITDRQLAWYTFSTLDQLDAVFQIQAFVPPGGRDTRLLVVGERVFGIRRENERCFRTNVGAGARSKRIDVSSELESSVLRIARMMGLVFASVDIIDNRDGPDLFLEVNAIPGWKAAQSVIDESIADCVIQTLQDESKKPGHE
ncbi:RimK family alpha-L-glutamate ligase [Stieleria sp. TO1_6]|uniref:ATP-grasp domain-containing protein n=1 Tax=Stieleria tagensis TaxID=2956795 RepID=UPI00209B444D|nr:RimK family alpha-L-glutamate ligase [Stieleria tagensis]MCO8123048.1 RimK family alpha-L-glutamate ligase [Stieleria tagensis]